MWLKEIRKEVIKWKKGRTNKQLIKKKKKERKKGNLVNKRKYWKGIKTKGRPTS
jgi:hypothetical protein